MPFDDFTVSEDTLDDIADLWSDAHELPVVNDEELGWSDIADDKVTELLVKYGGDHPNDSAVKTLLIVGFLMGVSTVLSDPEYGTNRADDKGETVAEYALRVTGA